jgi:signal transduction histidine kinase
VSARGLRRRATRDALLAGAVVLLGGCLFLRLDAVESVTSLLLRWEGFQLDDLLLTSGLAVAASTWFALRRLQDAGRQLRALQVSESEKARYVERLEELSTQLLESEQRERTRLAEALHDSVSQTLYACRLQLDRASALAADAETKRAIDEARELTSDAMAHTRELTADLSPPILHDLGLPDALEWLLPQLNARFAIQARLIPGKDWERIPQRLHAPVFHSVKELVINAGKHAAAAQVEVSASADSEDLVRVRVADDGRGFAREDANARGFGLFGIERRRACIGAALHIESRPDAGTTAELRLACGTPAALS